MSEDRQTWGDRLRALGARLLAPLGALWGRGKPEEPEPAAPKAKPMEIILWPAPILREPAKPVVQFGQANIDLLERMLATMKKKRARGLAAPQVGVGRRLILVASGNGGVVPMANPVIMAHIDGDPDDDDKMPVMDEGCLSFPGHWVRVKRPFAIAVHFQDPQTGEKLGMEASGQPARTILHEIDHLDGITLVDHAMSNQRKRIERSMKLRVQRDAERKARRERSALAG